MASVKEARLLSLIESSDGGDVFSLFSDYLRPFSGVSDNRTSKKRDQTLAVRSLAKQFLPFLNKSLSLLPKRLSNANPAQEDCESVKNLFHAYELCLDCLELVSAQLSCKPYTVQLQRLRLIHCFEAWGWHNQALSHAFRVLEKLRCSDSGSRERRFLPNAEHGEAELAMVVVEVVVAIFKCVTMSQERNASQYSTALGLLGEVKPWVRVLDAKACEKLQRLLVMHLGKCALSLVREAVDFDEDLVHSFCKATVEEYFESSLSKDQSYKFVRQVFSSLFALEEKKASLNIDVVMSMLRITACELQDEIDENWVELVDLVSYCSNKWRAAGTETCVRVSKHLGEIAATFSQAMPHLNLILRLYTVGLSISIYDFKFKEGEVKETSDEWGIRVLLDDEDRWKDLVDRWRNLAPLLGLAEGCSCDASMQTDLSSINGHNNSYGQTYGICKNKNKAYMDALYFLCQPLADFINSEKRKILMETEVSCASAHLSIIQDAFHRFGYDCLSLQRGMPDKGSGGVDYNKMLLNVAMAAFILSRRTQLKMEISVHLVKEMIASPWIQPRELKYIFTSLYNIGVTLYRSKQLEKASKAFKLCFRASWACVGLLCQMFVNQSNSSDDQLSEEAIIDFVSEACSRCAFYLDMLQQHGRHKIKKFTVDILERWSAAGDLIRRLPGPKPLVKQWVKMERRYQENLDMADSCTTLYSLLSSSTKFSKRTIGKILEQELLAYEEFFPLCSNLGCQLQVRIADILLKDVYVTDDMHLLRARILIWKARMTRISGTEHLRDCIQYLSEAISILVRIDHEPNTHGTPSCHQLPVAYCLRALCIQEAEPDSKDIFQDISTALTLWLRIPILGDSHEDCQYCMPPENMIPLLYSIIDLLSMKGCLDFHHHLYQLIFRLFKLKNVKMEVCLAMLWECRRLSHALCPSPINDAFIPSLSEYCSEKSKTTDFWIDCLKVSKAKLIGFQQNFHFLHYDLSHVADKRKIGFQSKITVDDVKDAASKLVSGVPPSSHSSFLAAYLYYDLCDRLVSHGKLPEALSYAREAHRIRTVTFQEKFKFTGEKQYGKHNDTGKITGTRFFGIKNIEVLKSIAVDVWPCGNFHWDINGYYLSPWNVLQCYLESTLQVGMVNEMIGNGTEAETFLSWGKTISCSQSLSPFVVAFSSALGNLYHKRQSLDLAEKEIQSAKQMLSDSCRDFSCLKCRLMLEVTLDKQLGNLARSHFDSANRDSSINGPSHARRLFSAALKKLSCSEWKDCSNHHTGANNNGIGIRNSGDKCLAEQLGKRQPSTKKEPTVNKDSRKSRTPNCLHSCLSKEQNLISGRGARLTRSKYRSLKEQCQSCSTGMGVSKKPSLSDGSNCFGDSLLETENTVLSICICNGGKCQHFPSEEIMESGLLKNLISLKWEFCRRKLACVVLLGLGKCFADSGELHHAHEAILQSISVLFNRKSSSHSSPSVGHLIDFIGKELEEDVFSVEHAEILYNMCWFTLINYHTKATRSACCDLSCIPLPNVASLLKLAFVLSRDVPILFQEVSRLLAALHLLSASDVEFQFQHDGKTLSASHWASYFHQASVGTHISYLFFSNVSQRHKPLSLSYSEATQASDSTCKGDKELDIPRLAPDHTQDLVEFAKHFFNSLPSSTIICISLLGGALSRLLQELTQFPSPVSAWLLLSRLNSKDQPVAILLPVDSALEDISDDESNPTFTEATENKDSDKPWLCPWGSAVVDDVAPAFKSILQENYISSSELPTEDTKENRYLWWIRRKKLDHRLGKFLRNLEDSWLGPWRYLLLGEWSNCKWSDALQKKLVNDLRSKCKMDVNETLLKVILGGGKDDFKGEACIAQLCLKDGCYVGRGDYFDEEDSCRTPTSASNTSENRHGLALQLIHEATTKLEQQEDTENREQIILVLDPEVQMLPWENIPILRRQEVYRMPSVGSISAVLRKHSLQEELVGSYVAPFPLIDPLDAFYLLNPGGDLSNTQLEFERWFQDQNLEGRAGSVPTAQELREALKNHDLFLYFGHGSGSQYISRHDIESLENCAATFLMGCSSGSFSLNGCYIPQGIPLSYLLAGSPAIVANLWEVTDKDIDRFGKAMLESWLRERSNSSASCSFCNSLADSLAVMHIKGNAKKKSSRKKTAETNVNINGCNHHPRRKIGSFMAAAREACNLPFLIGAAPVCYGVPTGIARKKKGLEACS